MDISIYIHIPLCLKKCAYCDFTSFEGRMAQKESYLKAVLCEMRAQAAFFGKLSVKTVFMGGGTPTLLSGDQAAFLMDELRAAFELADDAEVTMEGNPGTLTKKNLMGYRAAGVNRLSLGVQSFDDTLLAAVGRIHTAAQAEQAVHMARAAGFDNLNLDLMYGLPGQTVSQWEQTLDRAAALEPEHLSCYSLILEEGTPLFRQVQDKTCMPLPDEDTLCRMDELTAERTRSAGYERYEVSNYAKPGRQCRHNIVYWECLPYLGLGCAAHSDMGGRRFYNPSDWTAYMNGCERSFEDDGALKERMFERAMMGFRMTRGMDAARFEHDFGKRPEEVWPQSIQRMIRGGLMERQGSRLRLTAHGMQVMNAILVDMLSETEKETGV